MLNAEKRAAKVNKIRRDHAHMSACRLFDQQLESQYDARRIRTKVKLRYQYYDRLKRKDGTGRQNRKVLNRTEARRHFGTSAESMFSYSIAHDET